MGGSLGRCTGRQPVLLLHGLMHSSEVWVVNGRSGSVGFALADAGFDVWLGNNRGNRYSSKHQSKHVRSDEYWDFSVDDMARYDVPAMVDVRHCVGWLAGILSSLTHARVACSTSVRRRGRRRWQSWASRRAQHRRLWPSPPTLALQTRWPASWPSLLLSLSKVPQSPPNGCHDVCDRGVTWCACPSLCDRAATVVGVVPGHCK